MELDKLWTGNIGDVARGYCIDSFLSDTELGASSGCGSRSQESSIC